MNGGQERSGRAADRGAASIGPREVARTHLDRSGLHRRAANAHAAITWMACLDNDYFYSSLRTEVDARISFLTKGCIFEKHGRKGSPHDRLVWLTNDEQKIGWSKPPPSSKETTRKMTKDAFVYVEQIQAIERGRTTPVFKRRAGGHYKVSAQSCRYFF